jgi:regulator of protease activity HflC (stomatin/prohibitin superfamily)
MAIESINREFEVFMREMMKSQECVQENIESEFRRLIRVTVSSCATMYGFSAEEALKRLNSNGEIIEVPVVPSQQKDAEKAEKLRVKEAEKAEKLRVKEAEKAEKERVKQAEKTEKAQVKALEKEEKANECSERNQMKEQDIASKAIEKAEKLKLKKKKTVTKKVKDTHCESVASTVVMTDSEDEEIHILFQNLPLIEELSLIRNIKIQKKLSKGVILARQILDI